jgi:superfamily II DNA or RNA helicase/HKD family nuclease
MEKRLANGLYDSLITSELVAKIRDFEYVDKAPVKGEALDQYLLRALANALLEKFASIKSAEEKIQFSNELLAMLGSPTRVASQQEAEVLLGLVFQENQGTAHLKERPSGGLSQITLITNTGVGLNAGTELRKELPSADKVLILMAFVKKAGVAHLEKQLAILRNRKVPVQLVTSVYMAGTEADALDRLVREFGVEVRVCFDPDLARLHAKAWLMVRESGFTTAIIGSSNMSNSALFTGQEWNVRLSEVSSPEVISEFKVAFEAYWNTPTFKPYDPDKDRELLEDALRLARKDKKQTNTVFFVPNLDVEPRIHQVKMLEDLSFEREILGHHKNLVVAATGTGKTVLAALDYVGLEKQLGRKPKLLFVAHRKEILNQAMSTYRAVLKDKDFGEPYVGGAIPGHWQHVFASVQSLTSRDIKTFAKEAFDIVVIDEFHHATAETYREIIDHLKPTELLGLTATPERSDGTRVQDEFFEGRIASELRLWDAMDQGLLTPFQYFGIGEGKEVVDYSNVEWASGKYQAKSLSAAVTGNDLRDRLVIRELDKHVSNPAEMKALVFCVDQQHAEYVATMFANKAGLKTACVTAKTSSLDREKAIDHLRDGKIQVLTSVDVFNEGVDIPEVDTVIMLRPTESSVVFIQQLGRGLRLSAGKSAVTVLDFIGLHRADFRIDKKYSAFLGQGRKELKEQIRHGFPQLPSGVMMSLDYVAQDFILRNLENQLSLGVKQLAAEVKTAGSTNLKSFLEKADLKLDEVIAKSSWHDLCRSAGLPGYKELDSQENFLISRFKRLAHIDDSARIEGFQNLLFKQLGNWEDLADYDKRMVSMLFWNLFPDARISPELEAETYEEAFANIQKFPAVMREFREIIEAASVNVRKRSFPIQFKNFNAPLFTHASYTRDELLGALGWACLERNQLNPTQSKTRKSRGHQTGVAYLSDLDIDFFFVNLLKEESKFSVSTRYQDYALTPEIFCWDSQNSASLEHGDGARYASQKDTKHDVLIAMREKSDGGSFKLIGLADFESATGSRPIKIRWKLRTPLDAETFILSRAVKTA